MRLRGRGGRVIALLSTLGLCFSASAQANSQVVEYSRAVSYWYLPTAEEGIYRLYQIDVTRVEDLTNGNVSTTAHVITDKCREEWVSETQFVLYCGDGRRERTTHSADLVVADDFSSGTATITLGRATYVIHFKAPDNPSMGFFDRGKRCTPTDQREVVGVFANMGKAHGRLLGRRLKGPYTPGYDHAWLERGAGSWC